MDNSPQIEGTQEVERIERGIVHRAPEPARIDSPSKRKIRVQQIRAQIRSLQRELYELTSARRTPVRLSMRTWWGPCTRCGYIWLGTWLNSIDPPGHCARCHSAAWMDVPLEANDRHPEQGANPNWDRWPKRGDRDKSDDRDRKRGMYPRVRPPEPEREVPIAVLSDANGDIAPVIPIPPPPVRTSIVLPVPPLVPPPPMSLSAQLAARRSVNAEMPPQPERVVARHAPGQPIAGITDDDTDAAGEDQIAQDASVDVEIETETESETESESEENQ